MEHVAGNIEAKSGLHYNKLHAPVRTYVDNLRAQVYEVLGKYNVANMTEFIAKMKKVEVLDREKVIKLMGAIEMAYKKNEKPEWSAEFETIREREAKSLEEFFEKEIDVPPLPSEITFERFKKWETQGLKLYYLPAEDMRDYEHLKNWKKKSDCQELETSHCPVNWTVLKPGWILVDTRQKPNYDGGNQMYEEDSKGRIIEDFLLPVLLELNKQHLIQQRDSDDTAVAPTSRFGISPEELENPKVIQAFADAYGVKPEQVSLQRMIEFNVIGNMYHPEWGDTSCTEWFGDHYHANQDQLFGGGSYRGGLTYINSYSRDYHDDRIGFRLIVRFS